MSEFLRLLLSGLFLRCPYCGKGRLFRRFYRMHEQCPVCGWRYEREEGYWTGAIALNLVATELLIAIVTVPLVIWLAVSGLSVWPLVIIGVPMCIILPLLFFRHAKSFWMSLDFMVHPVDHEEQRAM